MAMENTRSSSLSSADLTDEYVLLPPQEGGGRREPSPSTMITPTRLRQKIKATTRDTGLIHEASFRRSFAPSTESSTVVPQSLDGDTNPFLSEPLSKTASNTCDNISITENLEGDDTPRPSQLKFCMAVPPLDTLTVKTASNARTDTSVAKHTESDNIPRSSLLKPSATVIPLDILSRGSSKPPPEQSAPSLHILAKSARSLAPPSALDKLGFEPAQSADELIKSIEPSRLMPAKLARGLAPPSALDKLGFEPVQSADELIKSIEPSRFMPRSTALPSQDLHTPCRHASPVLLPGSDSLLLPSNGEPETNSGRRTEDDEDPTYARGRLPDTLMDEFSEGFQQVNDIFTKLGESRGMPWQQVRDHYNRQYSHINSQNPWNIYTAYFAKHKETELTRIPDWNVEGTPSRLDVKKCYERFKVDYPEEYIEILETWKESQEADNIGGTVAQHHHLFNKAVKNLDRTFTGLSRAQGFEGCYVLAGRVVNQDGNLGHAFNTPGAEGFFSARCRAETDIIIAHLKAHIYNKVSLDGITEAFEGSTDPPTEVVAEGDKGKQRADKKKHQDDEDEVEIIERPTHEHVKQQIKKLVEAHGLMWASNAKQFPWKTLLSNLANSSLVMKNWPVDVLFPGEERRNRGSAKGISDLTLVDCSKLVDALKDTSDNRLQLEYVPNKKAALIASKSPVIINAPPPSDSKLQKGRRIFRNSAIDYNGPDRVHSLAATRIKIKKNKGKHRTVADTVEVLSIPDSDAVDEMPKIKQPKSDGNLLGVFPPQRSSKRRTATTSKVIILSSGTPSESEPSGDEYRPDEQPQGGQDDDMRTEDGEVDTDDTTRNINSDYEQEPSSRKRKLTESQMSDLKPKIKGSMRRKGETSKHSRMVSSKGLRTSKTRHRIPSSPMYVSLDDGYPVDSPAKNGVHPDIPDQGKGSVNVTQKNVQFEESQNSLKLCAPLATHANSSAFHNHDTQMPDSLPDVLPDAPGAMVGPASDAMDTSSSHDSAADTSTIADSSSNRVTPVSGRATRKPSCDAPDHESMQWHEARVKDGGASKLRAEPPMVPISTRPAADLFADHNDAPVGRSDIDFFTSRSSELVSTRGTSVPRSSRLASPPSISFDMSTARKGERPKPRLVQYENRPRNETEPFNLQERVLPHTGPSGGHPSHLTAKLLAAEEGHHPTSKGEADHAQGSDSHARSNSHDQHPGPEGGHQPHVHQNTHPTSHKHAFTQPSQQHGFNEQPRAPGMPPWMQGAPYDYGAALRAGWYPPPMTPYPPFYQPTMHPPYHGSYAEGAPQANYNAQQAAVNHGPDYYLGGIRGGYGTSTSLGQSATLPDVAAASTSLDVPVPNAPRLGSRALSESPPK